MCRNIMKLGAILFLTYLGLTFCITAQEAFGATPSPLDAETSSYEVNGILTSEELGYLTATERKEIFLLSGPELISKGLENIKNRKMLKAKVYFKVAVTKYESGSSNAAQTAWFFRALTRVAALAFDSAADGVEDGLQDIGDVLDRAGYSTTPSKRNPFNYANLARPAKLASNSPRGDDIQQFVYKIGMPELKGAINDLSNVLESFNKKWVEPLDGTSVESDYGDVLAFRSAFQASVAGILIQYAHDLDADTDKEYNLYYGSANTVEAFLDRNPDFGKLVALNRLQSSKGYLDAAAADALSAINWIQAETDSQSDDYISLKNATPEEIRNAKSKLKAFKKSLYGPATIDGQETPADPSDDTIINASLAFNGLDLRSFLPDFIGNVPRGFLPDPTFGGVLTEYMGRRPAKLNENLNGNKTADILDIIPRNFEAWHWGGTSAYVVWDAIKWDMLQVATKYNLYWATSPGVTKSSNRISTTQDWFLHTNLKSGKTYYYRIAAVTAAGEGPLSSEKSAFVR